MFSVISGSSYPTDVFSQANFLKEVCFLLLDAIKMVRNIMIDSWGWLVIGRRSYLGYFGFFFRY